MLKHLLLAATTCTASVALGNSIGLAEATGPFEVHRSADVITGTPESRLLVAENDVVATGESTVRVQTMDGRTVMMASQSEVGFPEGRPLELQSGRMMVSVPAGQDPGVAVRDLQLVPMKSGDAPAQSTIAVQSLKDEEIAIGVVGAPMAVRQLDGRQVAVLSSNDVLRLVKDATGSWIPAGGQAIPAGAISAQAAGDAAKTEAAPPAAKPADSGNGSDNKNLKLGLLGLGTAIAGYAGYIWWDDAHQDNRHDDVDYWTHHRHVDHLHDVESPTDPNDTRSGRVHYYKTHSKREDHHTDRDYWWRPTDWFEDWDW